ncbi:MAG: PAS domain-containing protein, partial [bacterium]
MKDRENITFQLESVITSLKKMEENAAIFSELGKISAELSALHDYINQGLQNIDTQFNSFTQSINLLSELLDFQKEVIHCKSSEKTIEHIFRFLIEKINYQHGFVVYKLKDDNRQYEIYFSDRSSQQKIKKFVESSNIEFLKSKFEGEVLSKLIADTTSFYTDKIKWSELNTKSAIVFPLIARGNVFGLGFLLREKDNFEMQDVSLINLVLGLISLILYQNFYFAVLKSRLIQQSKLLNSGEDFKFSKLFEKSPLYVFTLDNRQTILHTNLAAVRDIGDSEGSILGEDFLEMIPSSERPAAKKILLRIREKTLQIFRSPISMRSGQTEIVEFVISPLEIKSQTDLVLVIGAKVTENYHKERIERRNEILDEIDQFSRILVSQFNNLLTTIIPNIDLLKDSITTTNSNYQKLEQMEEAAQRSANLIKKLLNHDLEGLEEKQEANINKILNAYVSSKKSELPKNIKIKLEIDPVIKSTTLYPLKIRRLLDIIVGNSVIALQGRIRPEIQFSTSYISQQKDGLLGDKPYYLKAGQYIELCIRDNGLGIPEKALHEVLKPFYSTRIKNEGVGLEL